MSNFGYPLFASNHSEGCHRRILLETVVRSSPLTWATTRTRCIGGWVSCMILDVLCTTVEVAICLATNGSLDSLHQRGKFEVCETRRFGILYIVRRQISASIQLVGLAVRCTWGDTA